VSAHCASPLASASTASASITAPLAYGVVCAGFPVAHAAPPGVPGESTSTTTPLPAAMVVFRKAAPDSAAAR
jgi:hypothetical protein